MWAHESPSNKGFKRSNLLFRPYDRGGMLFNKVVGAGCRSPHCLMNPVFRLQRFRSGVSRSIPELAGHHSVFNDLHRQTPRWLLYGLSITESKKKRKLSRQFRLGFESPTCLRNFRSHSKLTGLTPLKLYEERYRMRRNGQQKKIKYFWLELLQVQAYKRRTLGKPKRKE